VPVITSSVGEELPRSVTESLTRGADTGGLGVHGPLTPTPTTAEN